MEQILRPKSVVDMFKPYAEVTYVDNEEKNTIISAAAALVKEEFAVDEKIANLDISQEYDDTELRNKITALENKTDNDTIYDDTEIRNLISNKADKSELPDLTEYAKSIDIPDVSSFITMSDLPDYSNTFAAKSHTHPEYVNPDYSNVYQPKGNYLTEHQDLSNYVLKNQTIQIYGGSEGYTGFPHVFYDNDVSGEMVINGKNDKLSFLNSQIEFIGDEIYAGTFEARTDVLVNGESVATKSWINSQGFSKGSTVDTSKFLDKTYTGINTLAGKIQIGDYTTNVNNAILHIRNVGTGSITGSKVNGACYAVNADGTATLQHKTYSDTGTNAKNAAVLRMSNKGLQFAINTGSSNTPSEAMYKDVAMKDDIPDVSGLASKSDIPDISGLASKSDIPDVSGYLPLSGGNLTSALGFTNTSGAGLYSIQSNGTNFYVKRNSASTSNNTSRIVFQNGSTSATMFEMYSGNIWTSGNVVAGYSNSGTVGTDKHYVSIYRSQNGGNTSVARQYVDYDTTDEMQWHLENLYNNTSVSSEMKLGVHGLKLRYSDNRTTATSGDWKTVVTEDKLDIALRKASNRGMFNAFSVLKRTPKELLEILPANDTQVCPLISRKLDSTESVYYYAVDNEEDDEYILNPNDSAAKQIKIIVDDEYLTDIIQGTTSVFKSTQQYYELTGDNNNRKYYIYWTSRDGWTKVVSTYMLSYVTFKPNVDSYIFATIG